MEESLLNLLSNIFKDTKINLEEIIEKNKDKINEFVKEYEDPDIHIRCNGKNKNGKRCSKPKKENSEYCSIHLSQQKDKDSDFLLTETLEKKELDSAPSSSKSIQILENSKKKGILPEKIKKILYNDKKFYINKNDWVYEMNQVTEEIISDIPLGKMFSGKLIQLKIEDI
jgi:hypothetical protein